MNPTKAKPDAGGRRASQGANAWTATSGTKHNPTLASARLLAVCAINAARQQLDRYAQETDNPDPAMVDAADLLDAASDALAGVP